MHRSFRLQDAPLICSYAIYRIARGGLEIRESGLDTLSLIERSGWIKRLQSYGSNIQSTVEEPELLEGFPRIIAQTAGPGSL